MKIFQNSEAFLQKQEGFFIFNPVQMITEIKTQLETKVKSIGQFVGKTPLFPIKNVFQKEGVQIFAKLEWQQLGMSVKARPAYQIIKDAVLRGELTEGKHLLDASSGNTAIAYASIGAAIGVPVTICLPENASEERKTYLKALGAELILTSRFGGTDDAQAVAKELAEQYPEKYYYADQYGNDSNWRAHYLTTSEEIYRQTNGLITHFVTGLGTTGTFTGNSRRLKELNPTIHLTSLEPNAAMHGLEGWKHLETAKVPAIYDPSIAHQNLEIDTYEACDLVKEVAHKEGLLISPSAGANLVGAIKVAQQIDEGIIVTVFADDASKYGEVMKVVFQ
ncbi:MAG: PLP-dependent cysteine synthase family protein [Flammeovirgaceae bacterium]